MSEKSLFSILDNAIETGLRIQEAMLLTSEVSDPCEALGCSEPTRQQVKTNRKAKVVVLTYARHRTIYIKAIDKPFDVSEFITILGYLEGKGYNITGAEIKRIGINIDNQYGCTFWKKGKGGL